MSGRWVRAGPRRICLVWRNDFTGGNVQAMKNRTFNLGGESLSRVRRLYVVRALVFVSDSAYAVHERALLALTVGDTQEVVGVSDPAVQGGAVQWSTCTAVLPATGDLGAGSFAFVYGAPGGRLLVAGGAGDTDTFDLSQVPVSWYFPLWPELPENKILQVVLELEAE